MKPGAKKNFTIFPVLDWIATLTAHIPNKGEQLVRYYGYYSNVSRGERKKEKPGEATAVSWKPEVIEVAPPPVSKELKKRWSYFIRKVYETDPLTCPNCQGEMQIISFIDRLASLKKSLSTWVYGKNPVARQAEIRQQKRLPSIHPTVRPFEFLTALRRIEG